MSFPYNQKQELRDLAIQRRKDKEDRNARICVLHRQGLAAGAIATRLGMGLMTVKGILRAAGLRPLHPHETPNFTFGDAI